MTILVQHKTKKALKDSVGKILQFQETSIFGRELNLPGKAIATNRERRWFAEVTVDSVGRLVKVK